MPHRHASALPSSIFTDEKGGESAALSPAQCPPLSLSGFREPLVPSFQRNITLMGEKGQQLCHVHPLTQLTRHLIVTRRDHGGICCAYVGKK